MKFSIKSKREKNILSPILLSFREVCTNEYIVPLGSELKQLYEDPSMGHSLRCLKTESIRPQLQMTEISLVNFGIISYN